MKKLSFTDKTWDRIFKTGFLLLGAIFLAFYVPASRNGRYQRYDQGKTLFDTRTGTFYVLSSGKINQFPPLTKMVDRKLKAKDHFQQK